MTTRSFIAGLAALALAACSGPQPAGTPPERRGASSALSGTRPNVGERPGDVTLAIGTSDGGGRLRIDAEEHERPARISLPAGPAALTVGLGHAGDAARAVQARMSTIVLHRR